MALYREYRRHVALWLRGETDRRFYLANQVDVTHVQDGTLC